jgi:hypothetical protein
MSASRLKAALPVGILATLCALSAGDCSNELVGPGDSVSIDAVYFESGMTVRDSVDARQVFELYVSHVESVTGTFPDGASHWEYRSSNETSWAGQDFWRVDFMSDGDPEMPINVHVDSQGRVVMVTFVVHSP